MNRALRGSYGRTVAFECCFHLMQHFLPVWFTNLGNVLSCCRHLPLPPYCLFLSGKTKVVAPFECKFFCDISRSLMLPSRPMKTALDYL